MNPQSPLKPHSRQFEALLLELGDPRSVDVLLQAVRAHPEEPGLRIDALRPGERARGTGS